MSFDAVEQIGTWNGLPPSGVQTYNFTVPANALNGTHRMRVTQEEGGFAPLDPCAGFTWGSVTDFGITITGGSNCAPPTGFMLTYFSNDTAVVVWSQGGTETEWDIEWGAQGLTVGTGTMSNNTTMRDTLTGLTAGSFYDYHAASICGPGDTSASTV